MKTANQLTFTTYEASLKLKPNDLMGVASHVDTTFAMRTLNLFRGHFETSLGSRPPGAPCSHSPWSL